ncbi:ISxac3 transposase [Stutzerimonas degradans]|nr:ISxac3 transposase [Stutzerimonas degradans]
MSNQRYPEEFKIEAVKHITERGLRVAEVAERLGVSAHSLYALGKALQQTPSTAAAGR